MQPKLLVIGGGFAGVWAALGAARAAQEHRFDVQVSLVSADPWLTLRPRLYEGSFRDARLLLDRFLGPVHVRRVEGYVTHIDDGTGVVRMRPRRGGESEESWDALVLATGSEVVRPAIPGFAEHAFTVDTFDDAVALDDALTARLSSNMSAPAVVVVGGGFTGLEVSTEMVGRVRSLWADEAPNVTLIDAAHDIAPSFGQGPRDVIERSLDDLGIRTVLGHRVDAVARDGVTLSDGTSLPADMVIWTAGLRANGLASRMGVPTDELGRIPVDRTLQVDELSRVWAAGDVARVTTDGEHLALQSCQHAQPQGRVAGHNAVAALAGVSPVVYEQPDYVTCLDLGPAGALFTRGWDRSVHAVGEHAKAIKRRINWDRIVPPTTGQAQDLLDAAAPTTVPVRG